MPDIATQIREYFDEVAERVTEEDVRIRAITERGIPIPNPRFRPRPLAAGAIGFGLAMTLLGVVLVADRVFGAGLSDAGSAGGSGWVSPSGDRGSPWLFIPVVAGLGLLATGIISARRHNGDMRERGEETMQTTIGRVESVDTPLDDEMLKLKKRNRWLGWLAGILVAVVVGLGVWVVASSSGGSIPSDVESAVNDYLSAWEATDASAFTEATTTSYTLMLNGEVTDRRYQAGGVGLLSYFRAEVVDQTVIGDGPYYVASTERIYLSESAPGIEGQSIYTVVEVDGTWKIGQHTWIGDS
jgi:hypothetical protein